MLGKANLFAYVLVSFVYGFYTGINNTFHEGGIENATEKATENELPVNRFDELKYYQELAGNVLTTKKFEQEVNVVGNVLSTKTFEGEGDENVVTDNELELNNYEEEEEEEQEEEEEEEEEGVEQIEVWTRSSSEEDLANVGKMAHQQIRFSKIDVDKMEEVMVSNKTSSEEDAKNIAEILANERSSAEEMENVPEIALPNTTSYGSEENVYGIVKGNALTTNMTRVEFLVHGRVKGRHL